MVVKTLLEREDDELNPRGDCDRTPLALASQEEHEKIVLLFERDSVDANIADRLGYRPLDWAVLFGNEATVKLLESSDHPQPCDQ